MSFGPAPPATGRLVAVEKVEPFIYRATMNDVVPANHLSEEMALALSAELAVLAEKPDLRVLILAGRSEVFCSGADFETVRKLTEGVLEKPFFALAQHLTSFPLPTIAALEGHAVGGGLALAMCCDMTIACESSRYGANFLSLGVTPGLGITGLLVEQLGHWAASEIFFTGRFFRGKELGQRGVFNHVVSRDQVMPLALDVARQIADKDPDVLRLMKETLAEPRLAILNRSQTRERLMHQLCAARQQALKIAEEAYVHPEKAR